MNPRPRHCQTGPAFTLIELLIAVAIFAIVLVAINTVFYGALHLRAKTTQALEDLLPTERALAILKRDLAGIVPPGVLAGVMSSDTTGVGMTQPVALEIFTATGVIDEDTPWGDIQKIDYSLQFPTNKANSTGRDLVRSVTRNLLATTAETPDQQLLIRDVQTLKFSYYDGTNWNDSWSATVSNIPAAIRVSIDFAANKTDARINIPVQMLVPIVSHTVTNQTQTTN
ncbi:MAG: type secretion system protein GspJ [Pedosphaera sp.]|nr:type secretion system protein GspJ [Pedosphaera sp.]